MPGASATGIDSRRDANWGNQRKRQFADDGPLAGRAVSDGPLAVGVGAESDLALLRQALELVAEHAIERIVETHDTERRDDATVFDPEGGKTSHSGDPRARSIGEVQVPEVTDVDAGIEGR